MAYREPLATGFQTPSDALGDDAVILREAVEAYSGPFAIYDADEKLIASNQQYRILHTKALNDLRALGQESIRIGDVLRITIRDAVPEDEWEACVAARLSAHRRADSKPFDQFYPEFGWIRYTRVRTSSNAVAVYGTDITELKTKTQDLEKAIYAAHAASDAKSSFLANVSHELRTPLNAIIGFAEALQMPEIGGLKDGTQKEYVGYIQSAGGHLLSVISQILDIAKIEAGELSVERHACCLYDITEECVSMLQVMAQESDVTIDIINNIEDTVVYGDRQRLKQVLLNIATNAVKFSEQGGIISITIDGEDERIVVSVADRGIGIPPDLIGHVFEAFGQVESAYSRSREGTGLGLPIARTLVEAHHGRLSLTSEVDEGTTVVIELPRH